MTNFQYDGSHLLEKNNSFTLSGEKDRMIMTDVNLNKTAIVTGAANGIGRAIAIKLMSSGYFTILADIDRDGGESLAGHLGSDKCRYISCNIGNEKDVENLFAQAGRWRQNIDVVVNNAGIIRDNMIWNMPFSDMEQVIDINLKGTWMMCKVAGIVMRKQKSGKIVNISSRAWLGNNRGQSNYTASKAGIVGLSRVLALELGKYNVNVNCIAPGLIDTPLIQGLPEETKSFLIDQQPTKRMGTPEDIANAVAFLVSDDSNFINGQIIHVDGGRSIGSTIF